MKKQHNYILALAPGYAQLLPIFILHRDKFLAPIKLAPHDARSQLGQGQRHDSLLAKVPGLVAGCMRQVTLTADIHWPLGAIVGHSDQSGNFLNFYSKD